MSVEDGIPEGGQATPEPTHDWEKDYKALQAEYTRSQQSLKEWDDEQTALTRFAEKFPHLVASEGEDTPAVPEYEDDEDPRFQKLTELEQRQKTHDEWIAKETARQNQAAFDSEVKEEAGDRSLSRQAKEWILQETVRLGNGRENLAKATKSWFEFEDELRGPQRKSAPTPPQPGKAAEIDRNASKDPAERRKARRAQIAAQIEAGMQ